jgi:hypothetical protein
MWISRSRQLVCLASLSLLQMVACQGSTAEESVASDPAAPPSSGLEGAPAGTTPSCAAPCQEAASPPVAPVAPAAERRLAGATTHFTQGIGDPKKALDLMKAAGMTSFREEATLEANDRTHQALDLAISPAYGMTPLVVISQHLTHTPMTELADKAAAVVGEYGTKVIYEIWNEWNNWPGTAAAKGSVASWTDYTTVLCKTYKAMKAVNPGVVVIGGGGVWLTDPAARSGIFENGGEKCMDAFSVHPYWAHFKGLPNGSGTRVMAAITAFHTWIKTTTGKDLPFYVTEDGWSTADTTEAIAATYLHDYFVAAKTVPFLKGIWWYEWSNAGAPGIEFNYGIVDENYVPKPAYNAMKSVASTF